jgi:hypothetical protein
MSPNHESVNEALSIAREGMNDAERGIEASRLKANGQRSNGP